MNGKSGLAGMAGMMGIMGVAGLAAGQLATVEYIGPGTIGDYHMNDAGSIVTRVWDGERLRVGVYSDGEPVRYVDPPGFEGTLAPRISNSGQVIFTVWQPAELWAMRHTPGSGAIGLNAPGVTWAFASGINDHGDVALSVMDSSQYAARWRDGIGMEPISTPASSPGMTHAAGINNQGQIAGTWEAPSPSRAVRYTHGVGIVELGAQGGTSVATAINNQGDVLGWYQLAPEDSGWFRYTDASGMVNLGLDTLGTTLRDMNDHGWIVGAQGSRAIVWTEATGVIDINTLLPGLAGILHGAEAVNNAGQIAAYGHVDGVWGIYRVTVHEIPAPGSVAVLVLVLGVAAARRRRQGITIGRGRCCGGDAGR